MRAAPLLPEGVSRERHRQLGGSLRKMREFSSLEGIGAQRAAEARHDSDSCSGSNGSAANLPSAFFRRISTLPSASSSCFWHSRESATPSSNNFIASSRESCGLSSLRTTSSSRARERSNSGFLGGSGFFATGLFTRRARSFDGFDAATFYGTAENGNNRLMKRTADERTNNYGAGCNVSLWRIVR